MRSLTTLNLSYNHISDLGNFTMLGYLQSLQHFRLNSNELVFCNAFFNEVLKMPMLVVLDIKSANMPCFCEIDVSINFINIIKIYTLVKKWKII